MVFFFEFSMVDENTRLKSCSRLHDKVLILGLAKHEERAIYKVSLLKITKDLEVKNLNSEQKPYFPMFVDLTEKKVVVVR